MTKSPKKFGHRFFQKSIYFRTPIFLGILFSWCFTIFLWMENALSFSYCIHFPYPRFWGQFLFEFENWKSGKEKPKKGQRKWFQRKCEFLFFWKCWQHFPSCVLIKYLVHSLVVLSLYFYVFFRLTTAFCNLPQLF